MILQGDLKSTAKKRLNYLDGKTWTKYSISIWDITKTPEETKLGHPAMFPVELCKRLIEIYTWPGETVLDPFMGSGSVLVAAKMLERKGIGFDVVPEFVELAKKRLTEIKPGIRRTTRITEYLEETDLTPDEREELDKYLKNISNMDIEPEVYCEDSRKLLDYIRPNSVDLCITSPPYWMIHKRERTADYKEPRPYSNLKDDLGNIENYDEFIEELAKVFCNVYKVLKQGKKCVVVVMDIRVGEKFIPFHMDITKMMHNIGFTLEDIIIWDRRLEYSNLRPLGYPYKFIVNKVHEYILIFGKNDKAID